MLFQQSRALAILQDRSNVSWAVIEWRVFTRLGALHTQLIHQRRHLLWDGRQLPTARLELNRFTIQRCIVRHEALGAAGNSLEHDRALPADRINRREQYL